MSSPMVRALPMQPYVGSVVFGRIMYHPTLGRDEYIEIRNRSSQVVPLYDPLYPDNTWKLVGGGHSLSTVLSCPPNRFC